MYLQRFFFIFFVSLMPSLFGVCLGLIVVIDDPYWAGVVFSNDFIAIFLASTVMNALWAAVMTLAWWLFEFGLKLAKENVRVRGD